MFTVHANETFDVITIIAMCVFIIEIVLSIVAYSSYCNSFYFWLDIVSTISMIFDISYLASIIGAGATNSVNSAQIFRASRVGKIGAKAGRVFRVLRLLRLFRISKIFKKAQAQNDEKVKRKDSQILKSKSVVNSDMDVSAIDRKEISHR